MIMKKIFLASVISIFSMCSIASAQLDEVHMGDITIDGDLNVLGDLDITGTSTHTDLTLTSQLLLPDGSAGTPSWAFTNSPTTGMIRTAADQIGVVIASNTRWEITDNRLGSLSAGTYKLTRAAMSATTPGLQREGDLDTGLGGGDDFVSVISGGVEMMRFVEAATDFIYTPLELFGIGTSTVNAEIDVWEGGTNTFRIAFDDSTGSSTSLYLWDSESDSLQQVLVAPDDTAGTGFKLLMIAN